jgi:hypothetical protein
MSEEKIAELCLEQADEDFEVWEENWSIVEMFLRMQTQWRIGFSGPTGLDYASLDWLCRLYAVQDPVPLFEGLQVMEAAALSAFNKKKS